MLQKIYFDQQTKSLYKIENAKKKIIIALYIESSINNNRIIPSYTETLSKGFGQNFAVSDVYFYIFVR